MTDGAGVGSHFVLTIDAVKESIAELNSRSIHPFFPAYLHLRQQSAVQGTTDAIRPNWNELGELLEVPGGPYGKPFYRPFWSGPSNAGQEWLNRNLAGSYAPSSIRTVPRKVIDINSDGSFRLLERHWDLALEYLANGVKLPVVALAGFFFRDFGFLAAEPPGPADLVQEFFGTFGYELRPNTEEMEHLYSDGWIGNEDLAWFEFDPSEQSQ
jgi:hypothetical protein